MKIYAMDRDFYDLKQYERSLSDTKNMVKCYTNLSALTEAVKQSEPDVILLESEATLLSAFVEETRKTYPEIKYVLVSQSKDMTVEQLNCQPDGFIIKPFTVDKFKKCMVRIKTRFLREQNSK